MAKLAGNIQFTGTLGGVSAYKMKGCDYIVLRAAAGPSKHRIKNSPKYARTRENAQEFGGAAKAASYLRYAMPRVERIRDYNFQPTLNKITKAIQKLERVSVRGERGVLFSQHHDMLKGFNLNKYHLFDTIVRSPVACTIDRETGSAVITLPALQRGINLDLPWPTPQFRFVAAIGVCDDLLFTNGRYAGRDRREAQPQSVKTQWYPANKRYAGENLTLQIGHPELLHEHSSLVVSIGIVFDMQHRSFGEDNEGPYSIGSAKILDMA